MAMTMGKTMTMTMGKNMLCLSVVLVLVFLTGKVHCEFGSDIEWKLEARGSSDGELLFSLFMNEGKGWN